MEDNTIGIKKENKPKEKWNKVKRKGGIWLLAPIKTLSIIFWEVNALEIERGNNKKREIIFQNLKDKFWCYLNKEEKEKWISLSSSVL